MKRGGVLVLIFTAFFLFSQPDRGVAASYLSGTIIKVSGAEEIYYIINGYAAHIPSMKAFNCMGLGRYPQVDVSYQQLKGMPKTAFLIKGSDAKVYRLDGEFKRHVPNLKVFRRKGFNDDEIIHVADGAISCIPKGPPLR